MVVAEKLASEFFLPAAELFVSRDTIFVPAHIQLNHVALFSQSPVAVRAASTFSPQIPRWFFKLCTWGMSSKGRKGVAAWVGLHLAPFLCLLSGIAAAQVWRQPLFRKCWMTPNESAEWQQRDCHSLTNHLECGTNPVLLYPNVLGANGEGCGEMLPSTPTACTCPELLLIGDPVAGAWRLSK